MGKIFRQTEIHETFGIRCKCERFSFKQEVLKMEDNNMNIIELIKFFIEEFFKATNVYEKC